ncbi:MAG: DUF4426 domain-containing protein [Porticoccaceae bacterium]
MKKLLLIPLLLLAVLRIATAEEFSHKVFDGYRVHYSAFNSSFISPGVASAYDIVRGKDRGLINITLVPDGVEGGRAAQVSGHATNIFAQQQPLAFFEVREGNAVYYLAPFKFENEDSLTFNIGVKPHPDKPAQTLTFQRKFYRDK